MIRFCEVSFSYAESSRLVLADCSLNVPEGELCLVMGPTGSGKSTLLGCVNNLVPRFTGGLRNGRIFIDGQDTTLAQPRELAELVGYVGQDPVAGFVTDTVEQELAYSMEQLGFAPDLMRTRVEEILDLLGIAELRQRALRTLSGGQAQRVAIGAGLVTQPKVLVLDEPTSALDPAAAEEVLALIYRLVHDLGTTVLIAEHRMERVVEFADSAILVQPDGCVISGDLAEVLAASPIQPPVVQLGMELGWTPVPLNIRDARRASAPLRRRWSEHPPVLPQPAPAGELVVEARGIIVTYQDLVAVAGVDLSLYEGQICALMGRNGSGKSSLLWALHGAGKKQAGEVTIHSEGKYPVALVPQTAADLLYLESVAEECAQIDDAASQQPGTSYGILCDLVGEIPPEMHPRDLSEGQKVALVLALQLAASPRVVLLDEPTRGLDYQAKEVLGKYLARLSQQGRAVMVATHDVEFVANVCDRVVLMSEGEIVADGPTRDVTASSALLGTQVAKISNPHALLTVDEFVEAAND